MFFRSSASLAPEVDIHSHLVPGVDDGAQTLEDSIEMIQAFVSLGYKKLITTPHVSEYYPANTPSFLRERLALLLKELQERGIQIELQLGAEYLMDGRLVHLLQNNEELLSWNDHVLIETTFVALPPFTDEVIFEIQSRGLIPVLAHPERYGYFFDRMEQLLELRQRGVLFQLTAGSFAGYYGREVMAMANRLLKKGAIDFVGSDAHRMKHMQFLKSGLASKKLSALKNTTLKNAYLS